MSCKRIIERMADVQRTRHIGRGIDDGIGFGVGPFGAVCAGGFPMLAPFGLNAGEVESFVDSHGRGLCQRGCDSARLWGF